MIVSSVPAVTEALTDALVAALPAAQVWDGPPTMPEDLLVAVGWSPNGPAATGNQVRATLGQDGRRSEDYELVVHCSGTSADDSPAGRRALREDTWALLGALEGLLSADPSLGGSVLLAEVGSYESDEGYCDAEDGDGFYAGRPGRYVSIDARVHVVNQLIPS